MSQKKKDILNRKSIASNYKLLKVTTNFVLFWFAINKISKVNNHI